MVPASSLLLAIGLAVSARAAALPRATTPLPSFVTEFAPLSYLFSGEAWFPADVATHLQHVTPEDGTDPVASTVTFSTIGSLGSDIYLTSNDNPFASTQAAWFNGIKPDATGFTPAPATIVAVNKPGGIVDAFYFYFYSYLRNTFMRYKHAKSTLSLGHELLLGFVAGVASRAVSMPLNLVTLRLQTEKEDTEDDPEDANSDTRPAPATDVLSVIKLIHSERGLLGFWRGMSSSSRII